MDEPKRNELDMTILGNGQFGEVHRDGNSAVKRFNNPEAMIQEIILTRYMRGSKYIISCKEFDLTGKSITLDLYDLSLKKALEYDLTESEKLVIFRDILFAVDDMHSKGLVHCDIKSANVLVSFGPPRAVLADLGIASLKEFGRYTQTPLGYRRPNDELGLQHGFRHDFYSLAVLGFSLFADAELDKQITPDRLREIIRNERGAIPDSVYPVLMEFTEDKPVRYPTIRSVLKDVYGIDREAEGAPDLKPLSSQRISKDDDKHIYDTVKAVTFSMGITAGRAGKRGYIVLKERFNNPNYPYVAPADYPLYISSMMIILSYIFNSPAYVYGYKAAIASMTLSDGKCPWNERDIDRALTDLISKQELMNIVLSPM